MENDIWLCLRDPLRRRIIELLRVRPTTTVELANAVERSRYVVMKHLKVLVAAGLVCSTRQGRSRWNRLDDSPLRQTVKPWLDGILIPWSPEILRQRGFVLADTELDGNSET